MRYHGRDTIRPARPDSARGLVALIDAAANLGAKTDLPQVTKARKIADREADIIATATRLRSGEGSNEASLGQQYYAGKLDDAALISAAVHMQSARDPRGTVQKILTAAKNAAANDAHNVLAEVGDRWITDVLRPVADPLIAQATARAEDIPDTAVIHPTTPTNQYDRLGITPAIRDAWHDLGDILTKLLEVHAIADAFRSLALLDTPAHTTTEELRWLYPDRLIGTTTVYEQLFVQSVRNGAQPGIYTAAELTATTVAA